MVKVALLDALSGMSDEQTIDMLLRTGPYGDRFLPWKEGLSLETLRQNPHGVDLGPMKPSRKSRVRKPEHKADLGCADVLLEVRRAAKEMDRAAEGLLLIGRRHVRSNNSWMHNCPSLVKGPERSVLLVHPDDAAKHGLTDGGRATVKSRVGRVEATVAVTEEVMPGVVSLPHGFGHQVAKGTMRVAGALGGPSMNALTDDSQVDALTGTAVLSGTPVTVEAYAANGTD